mgnify:CR=1 FL=1
MAPRWRPRPKGKNVIPFDVKRTRPPGGTRLGDIVPDPPINLEQIRKAKELELRNAIQSEGMSPFPEGKGLSGLGEETPVKDLPEEKGLSGLEEKVPVKTDIEKYDEAVEKQQRSRKEIDGRPYKNISLAELKVKAERIKEGFKEIERHGKDYFKNPTQAKKRKGESLQDYLVRLSKLVLKHKELPSQKGLRPLTPSLIKASLKNSN